MNRTLPNLLRPTALLASLVLLVASPLHAQGDEKPAKQDPESEAAQKEAIATLKKAMAEQGIRMDFKKKTLAIDVEAGRPTDPIEFLLITPRGKDHEAVLVTEIVPSVLNGALLALGLKPGTNATTEDLDPQPTEEEIRAGKPWFRVIPPTGMKVWMTISWKTDGEGGKPVEHECAIEDWLLDMTTERPVEDASFVYLGGRMGPLNRGEPDVFLCDYAGNVFSVIYRDPANHLVTMSHERASDDQVWWLTRRVPEPGTKAELTLHLTKPKIHVEREKRIAKERKIREEARREKKDADKRDNGKKDNGKKGDKQGGK